MEPLLQVTSVGFENNGSWALRSIDFSQQPLQNIAIAGETGSGKSTLLKIIAGLEQPSTGQVLFKGKKVVGPAYQLVPGHPKIAYLSQQFELAKFLRVEQVLSYANVLDEKTSLKIFSICAIDHLLDRKTHELSGGEKQRIALARLLIQRPKLLLLDEPFSNLDMSMKTTLKSVLYNVGDKLKITFILVSHDPQDVLPWADRILVLQEGVIIQQGSPHDIYKEPATRYAAGLFGTYTELNKKLIKQFGIVSHSKSILMRPEDFRIVQSGESSVRGIITEIQFKGDHQILRVAIDSTSVLVRSTMGRFQVGDFVSIASNVRISNVAF